MSDPVSFTINKLFLNVAIGERKPPGYWRKSLSQFFWNLNLVSIGPLQLKLCFLHKFRLNKNTFAIGKRLNTLHFAESDKKTWLEILDLSSK